ncbi:MAG: HAD family hydrolase [Bacilli bacterium]|jgi:pyrophosphatase PpaX|nr:HAD family hydrolase [Bacilli bacterium]MDD3389306.1 HAD family hydrolase [Bacilli bacterium]MDD4344361.1 HAD family hydrolase [Bacilli bacterium]MDD4521035.1 HAD family hydrolase [Bacilli bacterium]MDY0399704.1 HAD family hydrolase [Bacilli bacterium]
MKYQTLIFDMDGTLIDTDLMIVLTYVELFRLYRPEYKPTVKQMVHFSGPPLQKTIRESFPQADQELMIKEYKRISRKFYHDYAVGFPNEKEVLFALKNAGFKLAIITSKMRQDTFMCLDLLELEHDMFDFVIGSDDVENTKPHPEAMRKALSSLNCKKEDVLYIGDNAVDVEFAQSAGVDSMLVTWNIRQLPNNLKATYRVNSFQELLEVLNHGT